MPPKSADAVMQVAIVANDPQTLDGLQQYLVTAGIRCHSTRSIENAGAARTLATVVILFPDDFTNDAVLPFLRQLREARPKLLTLLVTSEPGRFRRAAAPDGRSRPPIVLPKPVFGWAILDAIRAYSGDGDNP